MNWQKIRLSILVFFVVVLALQMPATLYVNNVVTIDFMSLARIFQLVLAISLALASIKIPHRNFLKFFLSVSILVQEIATIKFEPTNELVAYNFIAILILISAITFKENLKQWLMFNFPLHLTALILPIFFKDHSLFSSIGLFIGNFLFGIFSLIVSLVVVAIYSTQEYFSSKFAQELQDQETRLNEEFEKIQKMKVQLEIGNLASQVAHDIRSPLSALEYITMNHLSESQEGKIARDSIRRIKGIADSLLEKGRANSKEHVGAHDINQLIKMAADTKKIEFPSRTIKLDLSNNNPKVSVDDIQLESILSNLINNALEASSANAEVVIKSEIINTSLTISITDSGKGISAELLTRLGQEKITMNKKDGNGLGVYSASQKIKHWGGNLEIKSKINEGTTILITLPIIEKVVSDETFVLLDDDELVRITWASRAKKAGLKLVTYSTPDALLSSIQRLPKNSVFYIDSELGSVKGEDIAFALHQDGFLNISMTSGHSPEKFKEFHFLRSVISKSAPF
jgi:signal transduction histidine kinase